MDSKVLREMVQGGQHPVITFTNVILGQETCVEPGMRGRLRKVRIYNDHTTIFEVDIEEFAEYNRRYEASDFKDKAGKATLTAREAGVYRPIEEIWCPLEGDVTEFVITEPAAIALMAQHMNEGDGISYVEWLESIVLSQTEFGKYLKSTFTQESKN